MYYSFPAFARLALRKKTADKPLAQTDTIEPKYVPAKTEESTDKAKELAEKPAEN